jgi:hypothetical protein
MNEILKLISIVTFVIFFGHFSLLLLHNTFRIKRLVKFVKKFQKDGKLSANDFKVLYERYTSFLSYLEFYPDKEDFKILYENSEFDKYVKRSKWILKYCIVVIGITFIILLIAVPLSGELY